jgi:hypothetical protein
MPYAIEWTRKVTRAAKRRAQKQAHKVQCEIT